MVRAWARPYIVPLVTPSAIDDLLSAPALAPVADALRSRVRPALRMRHADGLGRRPDDTPLGADKLGGLADVPRSLASPLYRRRCLILQLDLGRAHALLPECPLPRQGLLQLLHDGDSLDDANAFSLVVALHRPRSRPRRRRALSRRARRPPAGHPGPHAAAPRGITCLFRHLR